MKLLYNRNTQANACCQRRRHRPKREASENAEREASDAMDT